MFVITICCQLILYIWNKILVFIIVLYINCFVLFVLMLIKGWRYIECYM